MNRFTRLLGLVAVSVVLTACGGDDTTDPTSPDDPPAGAEEEPADASADTPAPAEGSADGGSVTVTGVDYGFEGLPETMDVGTTLEFTNGSDAEFHEMVVMKLADDEERSVDELLMLPDEEAMAAMTFVGVAAAGPGEDGTVLDGDLTLAEPGRYVVTCFIPVGADPAFVQEAFSGAGGGEGPPDLGDGAPHAMEGMVAEFVVE